MLSRVAENTLWMSRYVERAENSARILDVNLRVLLDIGLAGDQLSAWEPLVSLVPQTRALFDSLYEKLSPETICRFMTFDLANPNSIISAVGAARENARSIRESISSEMWEQLNSLYLWVTGRDGEELWISNPHTFYRRVQFGSQQFQGTTDATTLHDEGWHFIQVGRFLERADNATRILDTKLQVLTAPPSADTIDAVQLIAVLRSCSAYEAFRRRQLGARITPREVTHFLLLDPYFPRSVLFCIDAAWSALRAIGGTGMRHGNNAVERKLGVLRATLEYAEIDGVISDLHSYLDGLQRQMNEVSQALQEVYLYSLVRPILLNAEGRVAQAMEEQQQQVRVPC